MKCYGEFTTFSSSRLLAVNRRQTTRSKVSNFTAKKPGERILKVARQLEQIKYNRCKWEQRRKTGARRENAFSFIVWNNLINLLGLGSYNRGIIDFSPNSVRGTQCNHHPNAISSLACIAPYLLPIRINPMKGKGEEKRKEKLRFRSSTSSVKEQRKLENDVYIKSVCIFISFFSFEMNDSIFEKARGKNRKMELKHTTYTTFSRTRYSSLNRLKSYGTLNICRPDTHDFYPSCAKCGCFQFFGSPHPL